MMMNLIAFIISFGLGIYAIKQKQIRTASIDMFLAGTNFTFILIEILK
jgi:hypothetical protein